MSKGLKRRFGMAMATAIAMSMMVLPVSAADNSLSVEYGQATTYTLSIPAAVTLSSTAATSQSSIGVSAINTTPGEKVQVKIKSGITNGKVELVRENDNTTKVVSTVTGKNSAAVTNGFVVAEFQDMNTTAIDTNAGELNFSKVVDSTSESATVKAGTYKGTLVFEGAIVNR